jgi:chemotaxis protein CheD
VKLIVGVSDARVSDQAADVLVTYALGSCIGVAIYDPNVAIGGLLHFQLPCASSNPAQAAEQPLKYADSGIRWLIAAMTRLGAQKRRMKVRIAGAARMLNDQGMFDIGRRNHAAIRKVMWDNGMFIDAEHIGGTAPRNMTFNIGDGSLLIKCDDRSFQL